MAERSRRKSRRKSRALSGSKTPVPASSPMDPLPVLDPRATGIDVGSEALYVSIGGGAPRVFGTMTCDLEELCQWLVEEQVQSVAMEATGVYWICVYQALEAVGIDVMMVNGRDTQNVTGRKTDVSDSQWLATLLGHGLLRPAFVPPNHIRRIQDYVRLRQDHVALGASHVQHMQKALERMNLKPHDVISSLTGASGLKMIRAIVQGERDPRQLLALCTGQIRKHKSEPLLEALRGNWNPEHLFALRQALAAWDFYQNQIQECDGAISILLDELARSVPMTAVEAGSDPSSLPPGPSSGDGGILGDGRLATPPRSITAPGPAKQLSANAPRIPGLHDLLYRICGYVDATTIPGLADYSVLQLIAEVGTNLKRWATPKHFTSWLGLTPGNHQSGKRKGRVTRQRNRAGRIFCLIARTLSRSVDKALGAFYRRLRARRGGLVANKALARKIAEMFWRLMVHGAQYVEAGIEKYENQVRDTEHRALQRLAARHGFSLTPNAPHAQVHG